jgi:hypothetical protein
MHDLPRSAALAAWGSAVLAGTAAIDDAVTAVQGSDLPHAVDLRESLVTTWLDALTTMWSVRGVPRRTARLQARLDLAVARGLLHDLLLTGDRKGVDAAMRRYAESTVAVLLA